jgi:phosphomannomutase
MAASTVTSSRRVLALFDVDGTLTEARKEITSSMKEFMVLLSRAVTIGVVGGSDMAKQLEQLGEDGK